MKPAPRTAAALLAFLGLTASALFFVGLASDLPRLRLWTKAVPVLCLAVWVGVRRVDRAGRLVAAGLVLSAAGDVLLERGLFLPGLFAFLAAHLGYIAGFLAETRRLAPLRAVPVAVWCGLVLSVLWPGLGDLAAPVALYVTVIGAMIWRAAARIGPTGWPSSSEWVGLSGAILFALSDTLIAADRFLTPIPGVRWPIMLLYWVGQWAIAASMRRVAPAEQA